MAVIPLARQESVTTRAVAPELAQPQPAGPDPIAGAFAEGSSKMGGLLSNLAEIERKQLEQKFQNSILTELSQFETDERAKLLELNATGSGNKPFVTAALEGFEERAAKIGSVYSPELQAEVKMRLLPVRESIATTALALQQRRLEEEATINADVFADNLVNQVRWGMTAENTAVARIDEYAATLPDNLRLGAVTKMKESIRIASMDSAFEQNPEAFMQRVQAGEFNDVDSSTLYSRYRQAASDVASAKARAEAAEQREFEKASTDPYMAASMRLNRLGVANPTREQIMQTQRDMGVPDYRISAVSKDMAVGIVERMKSLQNPDEFAGFLAGVQQEVTKGGGDWSMVRRDVAKYAKESNLPNMAYLLEVTDPQKVMNYSPSFRQGVFEAAVNEKTEEYAITRLGKKEADKIKESVIKALENHNAARGRMGLRPDELERDTAFIANAALQAAVHAKDNNLAFDAAKAVLPPAAVGVLRFDNRNAYYVPQQLDDVLTPEYMESVRRAVINEEKLSVPSSMPSTLRATADLLRDSGWVAGENEDTVVLKIRGSDVFDSAGRPVVRSLSGMAAGKGESEVSFGNTRQGRLLSSDGKPNFAVKSTGKITTPSPSGVLRPPSDTGPRDPSLFPSAPAGNIQLLPPPAE